ncbi:TOBE domain-containing protein [Flavitalea flava]
MNTLQGEIIEIITADEISLVKVRADEWIFSSLVLDTPASSPYLQKGNPVKLLFKETEVIIAKLPQTGSGDHPVSPLAISIQNKIECSIEKIDNGKILCELTLLMQSQKTGTAWRIRSIITRNACEQLNLQPGEKIIALIKTNEVSLSPND